MAGAVSAAMTDNLIAYYSFEGNAKDNSTNKEDGSPYLGSYVTGKIGTAYYCDGTSSFITLPFNLKDTDWSINVWGNKQTSWTETVTVLWNDYNAGTVGLQLGKDEKSETPAFMFHDGTRWIYLEGNKTIAVSVWHMYTVTYNAATNDIKYYINGTLIDTRNSAFTATPPVTNYFCRYAAYYGKWYIDEAGFWNRTLSATDVTDLYNNNNGITWPLAGASDTTPPKIEWKDQKPELINPDTVISKTVNITYNMTDNIDMNQSNNAKWLNYSLNISGQPLLGYLNGTALNYFDRRAPSFNVTSNYSFSLGDNSILYAIANYNQTLMEQYTHYDYDCNLTKCQYLGQFYNFSNLNPYNIFELDVYQPPLTPFNLQIGLCNDNVTGVETSANCTQIFSNNVLPVNHSHAGGNSNHSTVTFTFNTANKTINNLWINGTIYVYVITNNNPSMRYNLGYIPNVSRPNAYQYYNGAKYVNLALSFDMHIHQNASNLMYQACGYDTSNNLNCSEMHKSLISGFPNGVPDAPLFTNPNATLLNFTNPLNNMTFLSWIIGENPDGAAMKNCSIDLINANTGAYIKNVNSSLGLNTTYEWFTKTNYSNVELNLTCCDVNNHCSNSLSFNFSQSYFDLPKGTSANDTQILLDILAAINTGNAQAEANWTNLFNKFDEVTLMIILYGIFAVCLALGLKYVSQIMLLSASSMLGIIGFVYMTKNSMIWSLSGTIILLISIAMFLNIWFFRKAQQEM